MAKGQLGRQGRRALRGSRVRLEEDRQALLASLARLEMLVRLVRPDQQAGQALKARLADRVLREWQDLQAETDRLERQGHLDRQESQALREPLGQRVAQVILEQWA